LFLLPGVAWFATERWWDQEKREPVEKIGTVKAQEQGLEAGVGPLGTTTKSWDESKSLR